MLLLKCVASGIHPAPVFEPEWIVYHPVHAYELITANRNLALCQVGDEGISVADILEHAIEDFEVIVAQTAEIVDLRGVESSKVVVQIAGDEFTLCKVIAGLWEHIATVHDNAGTNFLGHHRQAIILPPAPVQVGGE